MLFELLPHFARLVPMADKYLTSRSASERAQEAALAALAEEVRGELGKVTAAHTGADRQLQKQSKQLAEMSVEVTRARLGVESMEARFAELEKTAGMAIRLLAAVVVMLAGTLAMLGVVLLKLRH